jgi:hypothetical protein
MKKFFSTVLVAATALVGTQALATNYSLWIHGRNGGTTQRGNYADFSYWGPSSTAAGVNKKAVNWLGTQRIATENYRVRDALDCFCTGANWCYIAAHSAGNLQIGYALSLYGGSTRYKKNAVPNSTGVCGNTDGTTQVGWNIKWVDIASGAGGGSELADNGDWASSDPLTSDLGHQHGARHVQPQHHAREVVLHVRGRQGTLYSGILPGQDDEAVAYHSTGGVAPRAASATRVTGSATARSTPVPRRAATARPSGATTPWSCAMTARPMTTTPPATGRVSWARSAPTWPPTPTDPELLA